MTPEKADSWRIKNSDKLDQIVSIFRENKCLGRVELGSMKYITQNCEKTDSLNNHISEVQTLLSDLGVVLATGFNSDDGNFNVSILINRQDIAVSGSGLSLEYWKRLDSPWVKMVAGQSEGHTLVYFITWWVSKLRRNRSIG